MIVCSLFVQLFSIVCLYLYCCWCGFYEFQRGFFI